MVTNHWLAKGVWQCQIGTSELESSRRVFLQLQVFTAGERYRQLLMRMGALRTFRWKPSFYGGWFHFHRVESTLRLKIIMRIVHWPKKELVIQKSWLHLPPIQKPPKLSERSNSKSLSRIIRQMIPLWPRASKTLHGQALCRPGTAGQNSSLKNLENFLTPFSELGLILQPNVYTWVLRRNSAVRHLITALIKATLLKLIKSR